MKKFETVDDLAKAVGQMAGLTLELSKGHSLHTAAAVHHDSQAAFHKAAHDAMDDGHEMKAQIGKAHEHHVAKAAHHRAMAETHKTMEALANNINAAFGSEPEVKKTTTTSAPAPAGIEGMVAETTKGLVSKSLEMLQTDPTVQDEIRKMVLEGVRSALGGHIVPDGVRVAIPNNPPDDVLKHLKLVPRSGSGANLEKADVDPDMEDAFAI
jgi:hypothetical protein